MGESNSMTNIAAEDAAASPTNEAAPIANEPAVPGICGAGGEASPDMFAEMPDEELLFDVADLFKAFSDTTRIKILFALMGGGLSVGDITTVVGCTQSAVSHQLRILKQARLVRATRDGKNVIYALSDDHVYTMLAQGMTHVCE